MSAELKPCPFCGDDSAELAESAVPSIDYGSQKKAVYCNGCFCEGPTDNADAGAIEAWNRRAPLAHPAQQCKCQDIGHCDGSCAPYIGKPSDSAPALAAPSQPADPVAQAAQQPTGDEVTTDQCIELAAALEQQRALAIVAAVAASPTAQGETAVAAGMSLACEEIEYRLKNEQWDLGGVTIPLASHPAAEQAAAEGETPRTDALMRGRIFYANLGDIEREVIDHARQLERELAARRPVPAPKDHEIAKLVNELRDIAIKYHDHQSLRDRIQHVILDPLKAARRPVRELTDADILLAGTSANERIGDFCAVGPVQRYGFIEAVRAVLSKATGEGKS